MGFKTKNFTKLHGYENEKEDGNDMLNEEGMNILDDEMDDDFWDEESEDEEDEYTGFGHPFGTFSPFRYNHLGSDMDSKYKLYTKKELENENVKGFLSGLFSGIIGTVFILGVIKYILHKE